jgi:hypothetical protein
MIWLTGVKTTTLFILGAVALALRSTIQLLLDRSGHSNNATDFGLGVLFGVGAGLLMIVAWRSARKLRNH